MLLSGLQLLSLVRSHQRRCVLALFVGRSSLDVYVGMVVASVVVVLLLGGGCAVLVSARLPFVRCSHRLAYGRSLVHAVTFLAVHTAVVGGSIATGVLDAVVLLMGVVVAANGIMLARKLAGRCVGPRVLLERQGGGRSWRGRYHLVLLLVAAAVVPTCGGSRAGAVVARVRREERLQLVLGRRGVRGGWSRYSTQRGCERRCCCRCHCSRRRRCCCGCRCCRRHRCCCCS
mmetsp:Transcript_2777/g.10146  ORF Transcript_2777/g.10146 Transcript_2777/m.10146 type:complete len:231 (-) Transcript_2777:2846-3538(-)